MNSGCSQFMFMCVDIFGDKVHVFPLHAFVCVFYCQNSITPLHVASKWGRLNIVEFLVDRGAYKECKTRVSGDSIYLPALCHPALHSKY